MRTGLAAALAGLTALAAGCGGSGRLSHDAFVQRADAVCAAYDAQVQLLAKPSSYDDVITYVAKTLPLYIAAVDELKALRPPAADEETVRAWLAQEDAVAAALRRLRKAAMQHDPAATNSASATVQAASLAGRRAAAALGMSDCARP